MRNGKLLNPLPFCRQGIGVCVCCEHNQIGASSGLLETSKDSDDGLQGK